MASLTDRDNAAEEEHGDCVLDGENTVEHGGFAPPKSGTCTHCGMTFASRGVLFRHLRGEAGVVPCSAGAVVAPLPPKPQKFAVLLGYCGVDGNAAASAARDVGRAVVAAAAGACPAGQHPRSLVPVITANVEVAERFGESERSRTVCAQDLTDVPPASTFSGGGHHAAPAGFTHGAAGGLAVCAASAAGDVVTVEFSGGSTELEDLLEVTNSMLPEGLCAFALSAVPRHFNAECAASLRRHQYLLPARLLAKSGDVVPDLQTPSGLGCLSELLQRLKVILKQFEGIHFYHNMIGGTAQPNDCRCFVKRCSHYGLLVLRGELFICISVLSKMRGEQVCRIVALALAVMRGLLPNEVVPFVLGSRGILDIPKAPPSACLLAELHFADFEKTSATLLRPRREDRETKLFHKPGAGFDHRPDLFQACDSWRLRVLKRIAADELERRVVARWVEADLVSWARPALERFEALSGLEARVLPMPLPAEPPAAYRRVLELLRRTESDGSWPPTSAARKLVIGEAPVEVGPSGSFTGGAMPKDHWQPEANRSHTDLVDAIFDLEQDIAPDREGSSTVAINCRAGFLPHKDSGAGAGQSKSLIVALGDFSGGELLVEGVAHDVRYSPLEFDGWAHRHWTAPFAGERFSLVYFTPCGCEDRGWIKNPAKGTTM